MIKIFNIFRKKPIVHIVFCDFSYLKENINLKRIPLIGEQIYFTEEETYSVVNVITYGGKPNVVWVIVQKTGSETKVTLTIPDEALFIDK